MSCIQTRFNTGAYGNLDQFQSVIKNKNSASKILKKLGLTSNYSVYNWCKF